jgi:hypothetical protein
MKTKKKELTIDQSLEGIEKSIEKYDAMLKNDFWNEKGARKVIEERLNHLSFTKADLLRKKYGTQERIRGYRDPMPQSIEDTEALLKLINSV